MQRIKSGEIGTPQRVVVVPEPVPFVVPTWTPAAPQQTPAEVPQTIPAGARS